METRRTNKRKQPSAGRLVATVAIAPMTPPPTPNGNSRCSRYEMRARKCGKEVGSATSTPIRSSGRNRKGHETDETPSKWKAKFLPKVLGDSPTTKTTPAPAPTTPSLSSGGRERGDSSLKTYRRLDFDSPYFQIKTIPVCTEGGHCLLREVRRKSIAADNQQKTSLECNEKEYWLKEQELFRQRALSFIDSTRLVQGNRPFMGWKGSVMDSVGGVFLTQNTADSYSSSAFMSLVANYPTKHITGNGNGNQTEDAVDWNAVRRAKPSAVSRVIEKRGMNKNIAARIKMFLDKIHDKDSGLLDLEWLRNAKPKTAIDFFSGVFGFGMKSRDCLRLLTLRQPAFPVDRHIARIVVRLGWVPIEKLPDGLLLHELEEYPSMTSVQLYLSRRIGNLDAGTLYELHTQIITFGKVICTKKKPNCSSCPLKKDCAHFASASARISKPDASGEKRLVPVTPRKKFEFRLDQDVEDLCSDPEVHSHPGNYAGLLRTQHQVYELPDSHTLVQGLEKRDCHDKSPYLLAVWPLGETLQNPSGECNPLKSTEPGNGDSKEEEMVCGTYLIPCRTATRGSFPLDGTFFQINEVFADDESSTKPLVFPRKWLCDLTKKTLICGKSISAIFEGLSAQEILDCFLKGYVCIRGFCMKTRVARRLQERFHQKGGQPTKRTKGAVKRKKK